MATLNYRHKPHVWLLAKGTDPNNLNNDLFEVNAAVETLDDYAAVSGALENHRLGDPPQTESGRNYYLRFEVTGAKFTAGRFWSVSTQISVPKIDVGDPNGVVVRVVYPSDPNPLRGKTKVTYQDADNDASGGGGLFR